MLDNYVDVRFVLSLVTTCASVFFFTRQVLPIVEVRGCIKLKDCVIYNIYKPVDVSAGVMLLNVCALSTLYFHCSPWSVLFMAYAVLTELRAQCLFHLPLKPDEELIVHVEFLCAHT